MKKFIFVLMSMLVACVIASAQSTKVTDRSAVSGTHYTTSSARSSSSKDVETSYTWSNERDNVSYKIWLHQYSKGDKSGKWTAYVLRVSKKTGKEYKYYLPDGEAIANDIIKRNPNIIK